MIVQQLEAGARSVSVGARCPNHDRTTHSEDSENPADVLLVKQQRLLNQVLDAHEQERRLLANQIHEDLMQKMVGALLRLQAFEQPRKAGCQGTTIELRAAVKLLTDTIDEARKMANRLRPPTLDEFGMVPAINYLVCEVGRDGQMEIEFLHDDELAWPAPAVEIAVYRIVEELLANARRHSRTGKLRVELTQVDGHLRVAVRDWGIGFDPSRVGEDRFGLQEVRQRAGLLGGRTAIDSAPGRGTRVEVELPLAENTRRET